MPLTRAAGQPEQEIDMVRLLEVKNLQTRFHTPEGTVYAVNGISYHLDEGETLAVVGESGCGKSVSMLTMLRLIPIPPGEIVSGSVEFGGRDLISIPESELEKIRGKEISMVFQEPMTSLNPVLTVGRQLTEALRVHMGIDQTTANERGISLLEAVGIAEPRQRLGDYPHQFSGGMRQRVMIATALACNPLLLIADEPTTALDVTIQAQIVDLVVKLREQLGMAIIWVTHDLGVVAELADRVLVMYAGFIVEQADVYSLYADPRHPYTQALLAALPRADRRRKGSRLKSIPGAPPNLVALPKGCPFAARCSYRIERCWTENPTLATIDSGHQIACWVDIMKGVAR
jgi:oligopeptide transport system ATP-binding protein